MFLDVHYYYMFRNYQLDKSSKKFQQLTHEHCSDNFDYFQGDGFDFGNFDFGLDFDFDSGNSGSYFDSFVAGVVFENYFVVDLAAASGKRVDFVQRGRRLQIYHLKKLKSNF